MMQFNFTLDLELKERKKALILLIKIQLAG
jgi:hypothetical protein